MANHKKTVRKTATTTTKKKKAPASRAKAPTSKTKRAKARTRAAEPRVLTNEQRGQLLKPRGEFMATAATLAEVWPEHAHVKVPGLTPARLRTLTSRAAKTAEREARERTKLEARLRRLADARLVAHADLFGALLDVYAQVKAAARFEPGLEVSFQFLADNVKTGGGASSEPSALVAASGPSQGAGAGEKASG